MEIDITVDAGMQSCRRVGMYAAVHACICVYVYMCICVYVHMYVCVYVCVYVYMCGWLDGWTDGRMEIYFPDMSVCVCTWNCILYT